MKSISANLSLTPKSDIIAKHYKEGWELSQKEFHLQHPKGKPFPKNASSTSTTKFQVQLAKGKPISSRQKKIALYLCLACLFFLCLQAPATAQKLTQTIRGKVMDQDSQSPIMGASVIVVGTEPLLGSSTAVDGTFEIKLVPVGRHTLKINSLGYEEAAIPDLLIGSGKEIVLTIRLQESFTQLNEVIVSADPERGQPINDMATVSSRSFTVEETQRYAASINDPARMALSFAGVSSTDDGSNEIVVRGNSPRGVLWRMEGVEIPNPNHFGEEGAAGGGVSMLSANMMDASDFFTGAFPAEYGNAFSGIFDINLRKGNNQKREYAAQVGLMGVDFAAEGPFSGSYRGSYLVNYRYSTLGILAELGVQGFGSAIPIFQDLSYKFHLPTKNAGVFNVWGLGGLSNQETDEKEESYTFSYNMGVTGLSHRMILSDKTFMETIISASRSKNAYEYFESEKSYNYADEFWKTNYRGSWLLNHKVNGGNTLRGGVIVSHEQYDLLQAFSDPDTSAVEVDARGATQLYQAYGQWKSRLTRDLTLNAGLHTMLLALNNNYSIEPRFGLKWAFAPNQSLNAGLGVHSKMEPLVIYFSKTSNMGLPNKDLEFMKALHYVVGHEWAFHADWSLKSEIYYQQLRNVPIAVEGIDDPQWLGYSTINYNGGMVNQALVNEGSGRNYGMEVTLEKSFTRNYYLTFTGAIFESKYTGRDGVERDTRYNGNFTANLLLGKEFHVGRSGNNILGLNLRTLTSGGRRWTPVLLEQSQQKGETVFDWTKRYTEREGIYFRSDVRISYRRNKSHHASIWSLDIQNTSNHKNVWAKHYNAKDQQIETIYQVGIIPVLNYRLEF